LAPHRHLPKRLYLLEELTVFGKVNFYPFLSNIKLINSNVIYLIVYFVFNIFQLEPFH
jgi:hypothetical protein